MPMPEAMKEEYEGLVRAKSPDNYDRYSAHGFHVDDVVKAPDRKNFGTILTINDGMARVHFRNPVTGRTATKSFKLDTLEKVGQSAKESQALPHLRDGADNSHDTPFLPQPPTFPLAVFPSAVQRIVEEHSRAFAVSMDIPGCALLSLVGACIGRSRGVLIRSGWIEHSNLWIVIVGESGTGKSPATRSIQAPAFQLEHKWYGEYREALKQHQHELEKRNSVARKDRLNLGLPPEPPAWKQLILDDATPEALTDALESNPKGILWYRDELAGLILDLDKYSSGKDGSTKSRLMSAYDSGPWKVNRVSKRRFIPHANLSIFGTIQPAALPAIFSNMDAATGFLPRFIFVRTVQSQPPVWTDDSVSVESKDTLTTLIENLLGFDMNSDDEPLVIGVEQSAKAIFKAWYDHQAYEPWVEAEANVYKAVLAKLRGQCLRLALNLHCIDAVLAGHSEMKALTAKTMEKAIRLANYFKEHQKTVWELVVQSTGARELTPVQRRVVCALLELEGAIENGVLFTQQVVDHLNKNASDSFKVRAETVGKALVTLGFKTRKSDGHKCFDIAPDDLVRLQQATSNEVPTIPNVPQSSSGANRDGEDNVPARPLTSLEFLYDRDVRDDSGTPGTASNPALDQEGGMVGTSGMQPEQDSENEMEEWEV
jgi:hypothetical protein